MTDVRCEDSNEQGATANQAWLRSVGLGLLLTVWQVSLCLILSGQSSFAERYRALAQWDTVCYASIVELGYVVPEHLTLENCGNTAWFPGFPVLARAVGGATGLESLPACLLTSQLCCWLFWTYLLLIMDRRNLPAQWQGFAVLFLLVQPGVFFLVSGYSESLFLACLLGMIYWCDRGTPWAEFIGALHGFGMSATRIVGAPLAIYPLLRGVCCERRLRAVNRWPQLNRLGWLAGCAALGGLGTILFFAYCQMTFHRWDLYFRIEEVGWNLKPNYFWFFTSKPYYPRPLVGFTQGFPAPAWLSQVMVQILLGVFAVLAWYEGKAWWAGQDVGLQTRLSLYLMAAGMFYVNVAAKNHLYMDGMTRFSIPIWVLLILALLQRWQQAQHASSTVPHLGYSRRWAFVYSVAFLTQLYYIYRFTHGQWVA